MPSYLVYIGAPAQTGLHHAVVVGQCPTHVRASPAPATAAARQVPMSTTPPQVMSYVRAAL
jgi:hypothetical protein